jgi:hypothetical protein
MVLKIAVLYIVHRINSVPSYSNPTLAPGAMYRARIPPP